MRTVKALIDEGALLCKSDAELGRRIGKTRSQIADMRSGREPVSPETVALICDVLQLDGDEARRLAALAIVENPKNARKAEVLRRAFFVSWALGVVVLATVTTTVEANDRFTVYTLCALLLLLKYLGVALRARALWLRH